VLAALMRLKQICNHPAHALKDGSRLVGRSGKLTRFDELVTELLDQGERALVELVRLLDETGATLVSVNLARPTPDDVFLTVTGRSLREAAAA